jgi:ribosomal protein S18 acetylase RimI-like enzyme
VTERFLIEELRSDHDRRGFESGVEALDRYLSERVGQDARRNIASCYVARLPEVPRILGYYTISMSGTSLEEFPAEAARKLPRYSSIPAALIGRLAVDRSCGGQGLGSALLLNAVTRAVRSDIAAYAAVVEAKDEHAAAFYRHHGFTPLVGERLRLFLPLGEAARRLNINVKGSRA